MPCRIFILYQLPPPPSPGFDVSQPCLWIAEGLIGYLACDEGAQLMAAMYACSAPASRLVMTCPPTPQVQAGGGGGQMTGVHRTAAEGIFCLEEPDRAKPTSLNSPIPATTL